MTKMTSKKVAKLDEWCVYDFSLCNFVGSQTFAYQASANRTFAHRFSPITHLPIKTYAYQKLNMKSRLWPIMVGLLPIIKNEHACYIWNFLSVSTLFAQCTSQNLEIKNLPHNEEAKKRKLNVEELKHSMMGVLFINGDDSRHQAKFRYGLL